METGNGKICNGCILVPVGLSEIPASRVYTSDDWYPKANVNHWWTTLTGWEIATRSSVIFSHSQTLDLMNNRTADDIIKRLSTYKNPTIIIPYSLLSADAACMIPMIQQMGKAKFSGDSE